uniref:Uncharacterized protein n=1 Tax=Acrobeloides nanus TaxID=290746 RepID=A0A914BYU0_9BILA
MNTVHKNAFRKYQNLEELRIDKCPNLDLIDKFAFKGLQKLRLLTISNNPKLTHIYKATFAGIGNEDSLKIILKNNFLERIHGMAFKNVHNLRELTIEDRCMKIASHAFSTLTKVDFFTLKGVCSFEEQAFSNASRIHQLHIFDSSANFVRNMFVQLSHVNQILIHESAIARIEEEAFTEMFTISSVQIQSNKIGRVDPRAFVGMENLGTLIFSYNTVRDPLESPECLLNSAQKMVFTENTLHCSCPMRWVEHYEDRTVLHENYCGKEEAFKTLAFFQPRGCPSPETTPDPSLMTEIITWPTSTLHSYSTSNASCFGPFILITILCCFISIRFTCMNFYPFNAPYILLVLP